MATLLTITSQVMRGRVGGSLTTSALEMLGDEVWALPTILLSTRPKYGAMAVHEFPSNDIRAFAGTLEKDGALKELDAVMTGYFPSAAHVEAAAETISAIMALRPDVPFLCDPVMGDSDKGLYIPEDAATAVRDLLVPLADIITPNRFELEWLSGSTGIQEGAAKLAPPAVIVTSAEQTSNTITNLFIECGKSRSIESRYFPGIPNGTGDLFAALLTHFRAKGLPPYAGFRRASSLLEDVAAASAGEDILHFAKVLKAGGKTRVCGVDGCPAGWLAVLWNGAEKAHAHLCETFADVLKLNAAIVGVDMPIGFPEKMAKSGRECERAVRAVLGDRQSSVFAIPARDAVMCDDYRAACEINLGLSDPPRKISRQSFALFPKMREIDALITPTLQERVFEVHPEAAFWAMNGKASLPVPKKIKSRPNPEGLEFRRGLLAKSGFPIENLEHPAWPASKVGPDDILDACAAAFSAWRILVGEHITLPHEPERDGKGLRMEINA
ncbi:MAG: PfkB family carbohydrate kinase [Hyphomicrobiales bacterium]